MLKIDLQNYDVCVILRLQGIVQIRIETHSVVNFRKTNNYCFFKKQRSFQGGNGKVCAITKTVYFPILNDIYINDNNNLIKKLQ